MDGALATPTTCSVANLFSTVGGDISVDAVISDLNIFRPSLPQWDSPQHPRSTYCPTTMESASTSSAAALPCEPGPSSENLSGTATGACRHAAMTGLEPVLNLPMTPPTSDSGPPSANTSNRTENQSDTDQEMPPRKKRAPVPVEKKDERYWERRKKNNVAAKRSRELRRKKIDDELKQAQDAIHENQKLKQEIEVLKAEINSLRRLLKDANMTLSLWIRAKQTAEPNAQLPPMLRGPNVPFVNFPVSSTV